MYFNNQNLLFVAHDAGAAEILYSIYKRNKKNNQIWIDVRGPAYNIFQREGEQRKLVSINDYRERLHRDIDCIITGTSINNIHELTYLKAAQENNTKSISVLDHWTNYIARFQLENHIVLPKMIWVFDDHAEYLASETFSDTILVKYKNPYIEDQIRIYSDIVCTEVEHALYVCQNLNDNRENIPFNDVDCISFFLQNKKYCDSVSKGVIANKVCIRLHPSQANLDVSSLKTEFPNIDLVISEKNSLLIDIKNSSYVVGVDTMAMAISYELGKDVYCAIPSKDYSEYFNLLPYEKNIKKIYEQKGTDNE